MEGYADGRLVVMADEFTAIRLLVPLTPQLQEKGLQGFHEPGAREGMAFVSSRYPAEDDIGLWMATLKFPLSWLWLGRDGKISHVVHRVQPGDTASRTYRGIAAIEVHHGLPDEVGMRAGQRYQMTVDWPPPRP